jgi:quercetin dioxygenase-like cupin family protein
MIRTVTVLGALLLGGLAAPVQAEPPGLTVDTLLETTTTILDQPFTYPAGTAKITAAVLTVHPQGTVPPHEHPVPLFAYILQGSITVVYEGVGPITYRAGDSFVEAFQWPHHAYNTGRGIVKILTVYAGAEGVPNTVSLPDD